MILLTKRKQNIHCPCWKKWHLVSLWLSLKFCSLFPAFGFPFLLQGTKFLFLLLVFHSYCKVPNSFSCFWFSILTARYQILFPAFGFPFLLQGTKFFFLLLVFHSYCKVPNSFSCFWFSILTARYQILCAYLFSLDWIVIISSAEADFVDLTKC